MRRKQKKWLIELICISILIQQILLPQGLSVSAASRGICIASVLNIRTGPGTDYDKVLVDGQEAFLIKNQEVTILGEEEGWYKISTTFLGQEVEGYCLGTYIQMVEEESTSPTLAPTPTPTPTEAPKAVVKVTYQLSIPAKVTASELNLRETAGASGKKLASLKKDTSVTIIGGAYSGTEKWYYVSTKVGNKTVKGYLLSTYVACTFKKGFYVKLNAKTALLTAPGTGSTAVKIAGKPISVKKGTIIWASAERTVSGVKWIRVGQVINGKTVRGYVPAGKLYLLGTKKTIKVTPTSTPTPTPIVTSTPSEESKPSTTPKPSGTPEPTKVPSSTVTPTPTKTPSQTTDGNSSSAALNLPAKVNATSLNLRKEATTNSSKIASLPNGTELTVQSTKLNGSEIWYYITANVEGTDVKGYVLSNYAIFTFAKGFYGLINTDNVIMYKAAGSGQTSVTLSDGSSVSLEEGTFVWMSAEQTVNGTKYFQVGLTLEGKATRGFVKANQLTVTGKKTTVSIPSTPNTTPTPTVTPTVTPKPTNTPIPTDTISPTPTPAQKIFTAKGVIKDANALAVKTEPGYSSNFVMDQNGYAVTLSQGREVNIYGSYYVENITWYHISFDYSGIEYYGYVNEKYITVDDNSMTEGNGSTGEDTSGSIGAVDFETKLSNEGFPESYKTYLRQLHQMYPNWEFTAYHTGLDWSTVIQKQGTVGRNLITNSKGIGWKSLETGAYNWKTDSFIAYDGSTWVTASKDAIAYYMDPRNFLTANGIFQFELLAYKPSYQNLAGVESILKNTPLYNTSYQYTDESGVIKTMTYGSTFMEAAVYSGVSPYHLASRVKQEVVSSTTRLSNSVSGTVDGFEGLYNFYNIGAFGSTAPGGAIANGLKYAKYGSTNATLNMNSLISWTNQYRAIVGGAYIIGNSYISRGQDTIYLQKFNVTPTSTHSHQYMTNVEAPYAESKKVYAAYSSMDATPIVFSIPVYLNMPSSPCPAPQIAYNPNNWLSSLTVMDDMGNTLPLTPTFDLSKNQEYYLVLNSSYTGINITAKTVSSKASVFGTGYFNLLPGENNVVISVTAENGDVRNYLINVVRQEQ